MLHEHRSGRARQQRGLTLISLVFWAIAIAMVAVLTLRVIPTVNEFYTIKHAVTQAARQGGGTVAEVRGAFDKLKQVEYSIQSIGGQDLTVSKENDRIVVSFAYDKEIGLFGPVYLLLKYRGRSE
jgi:hypothetical protein